MSSPSAPAAGVVADELDERVIPVVAARGGPVDDDRLSDRRQLGLELDLHEVGEAAEADDVGAVWGWRRCYSS